MNKVDLTVYLVTDSTNLTLEQLTQTVEKACKGGVTLVQLREKQRGGKEYLEYAKAVKAITDRYRIPLIIDDRADIALACDAAGVHVGSEDLPVADVRKLLGPEKIVGATAKTVAAALKAEADGADYVGTGAIYPTTTKVKTVLTDVSVLKEICHTIRIPVCAIGGLNCDNCGILTGTGISGVAVVSAIMKSPNPEEAARKLKQKSEELKRS
ncbi:MAG: thiamine phosphate synthase [Lachnospiraceae bacterium]|nr:thiamine phosphate synthase [Lachnospiraceae bacterium]